MICSEIKSNLFRNINHSVETERGKAGRLRLDCCLTSDCADGRAQLSKRFEILHVVNIIDPTPRNNRESLFILCNYGFFFHPHPNCLEAIIHFSETWTHSVMYAGLYNTGSSSCLSLLNAGTTKASVTTWPAHEPFCFETGSHVVQAGFQTC